MSNETSNSAGQLRSYIERAERASDFIAALEAEEIWREVEGWPLYEVSSHGRVRSRFRILIAVPRSGYPSVSLSAGERKQCFTVHRLVALAFLGPAPFVGAQVAHNDGDVWNARISNLRWASAKENQHDRRRHNTACFGSRVHNAKLGETDIPSIRARLAAKEPLKTIAATYGVHVDTIRLIRLGRTWKRAGGAAWGAH